MVHSLKSLRVGTFVDIFKSYIKSQFHEPFVKVSFAWMRTQRFVVERLNFEKKKSKEETKNNPRVLW